MVRYEKYLIHICTMKKTKTAKKADTKKAVVKETAVKKVVNKDLVLLGKRIKEIRIKKGYSNYENFAFEHNIPRSQFGRYENGEDLRYSSLIRLIRAFGMTVEEFFEGIE